MKRKSAIAIICVLAVLLLAAPLSYAWFSYSLKSEAHMDSYVHKSYFESGDGTGATQFAGSGLSSEEGCAFEIKYPVQLYYFAWLQALGYFNIPQNGSEIEQVYFYLSDDLDMTGWVLPQVGTQTYPFVGNFNGNGHTISNLTVQNVEGTGPNAWTDKPDDITGLNIVGFFGVVGSLNPAGSANAGEVNAAVSSGSSFTPTAGYTYDNAVNEIKNFILEDTVIKTDLANSLAGIAAGYVNGTMENVKVVGGTLHSTATTALTYTANLSDYGAVGYCTADYRGTNSVVTVYVYDPQVYTNANGSAMEQGNNWGNSVEIQTMYEDLNAVYSGSGSAITYANSVTVTHHADGTVTEVLSNDGTTVNLTVQTYPVHVTEVDDDGNVIASYALIEQNATSDFVYLYGEHLADTVTQQVTDVYEKDSYYIYHDDGTTAHNLAFSGTAFSDEARANATKWVIEDSGTDTKVIYTIIGNNKYYLKNDAGALAYTGAGVTAAVPADATEWTVTDTTISNDGRYLCFRSNEWRLMLQDRLLITDDNEVGAQHFLTVVNGNYADTMVRDDAVSWTKTMASDDPDETEFYLSATVGTTTYYLSQNNGNLLLQTIDSPNASTAKWKYKAATETEKSKVYTVYNNDGDGYALYYEDSDDVLNWALTDFSEVAAGSGSGDSFGDSIPMQTIYNQLKAIRDTYSVTTYTNTKLIIVDEAEGTTNETTTSATLPTQSSTAGNWSAQVRTYQFLPYGQVTLTARDLENNTNDYIYVTDTSDTNPTNVVKVVYHAETESAMYISSGGNYLNLNAAGSAVTTAAPTNGNTKWRLTNQGYLRSEINGVWYYLIINNSNQLAIDDDPSTVWTDHGDGRISGSRNATDYYIYYDGGWKLTPVGTYYYITDGSGHYLSATTSSVTNAGSTAASVKWDISNPTGSTTTVSAYIEGARYYLRCDGTLTVGASYTWNRDGNVLYTTVQGIRYNLVYDSGWKIVPASGVKITDGNGHYLTATASEPGNAATASEAVVWQLSNASGNTQIFTVLNNDKYYLIYNNGLDVDTNPVTWKRSGNSFYITSGNHDYYLAYDGAWTVTRRDYFTINDGSGNYLRVTGDNTFANGGTGNATHFYFSNENGASSSGTVYCYVENEVYYLRNNNGTLETSNQANATSWTNDGNSLYVTSGINTYAIEYSTDWHIKRIASGYYITDGTNYMTVSGTTIGNTTDPNEAAVFTFSNTGANPSGTIQVAGTNYYLRYNNGTLSISNTSSNWSNDGTRLYYAGNNNNQRRNLGYFNGSWQMTTSNATSVTESLGYTISYNGHYLCVDSNGSLYNTDTASQATYWSGNSGQIYAVGTNYYLYRDGTTLRTNSGSGTSWTNSNNQLYVTQSGGGIFSQTQYYWVTYNNGWTIGNGTAWWGTPTMTTLSITEQTRSITVTSRAVALDTTRPTVRVGPVTIAAPSLTLNDYSYPGTALTFSGPNNETVTMTGTAAQTFTRTEYTEPTGETYFPLSVDNTTEGTDPYTVAKRNTGYIISGYSDETGDIRVSQYRKTDITNSLNNTNNSGQLQTTQIYTRNASGPTLLTTTYVNNNFKKYSDSVVNGETVEGSLTKLNRTLSGTQNVYGLHFMNAQISTNNLAVLPYAKINGKEYTDYQMPKDSIDFTLKERGYINFFAGTYYSDNNCFFSLHKIERYEETDAEVIAGTKNVRDVKSIKEIKAIYGTGNESDPYVYKFSDTDYETWTFYPSGNIKEHNTYSSLPPGYSSTALFDTSWITDTSINYQSSYANRVFYFEIPVDKGEYALGSVSGGTGAYLMYLDIGTAGTALKPEGNARLEEIVFNDLTVLHSDAGTVTYTVTGGTRPYEVKTNPTYFPLAWEAENGVRTGEVADTNTGYVISGANTDSRPPGDIRVSRYTKYANGNWASIRASLTSQDSAGILNDSAVYTIIDGQQVNIADYGIGKLYTMQYGTVAKSVNAMLSNNQYVYGLHFMQATISKDSTVTAEKAVINGVEKTNYVMPQDCIDFNVATKGRIAFMAGTYFSGSNGVQSFFSLHRIFRDGSGAITDIKQLSEIYTDGDAEHGYIYRFAGDAAYYNADGTLNGNSVPSGYVLIYDLTAIDDPTSLAGISGLTQNSVYYFEIPVDAGEYALGSSNSDGAYLIYLDIAANASFAVQTVITEVTVREEYTNHFPLGVAFVDSADSTAFDTNGAADPGKSGFISIPAGANSNGDTVFAIAEDGDFSVTNAASSLAGYTVQTIAQNGSLTVNGVAVPAVIESTSVTEKVTVIMLDLGGTTTTTVTTTTQTTEGNNAPVTTVTQTVTTEFNGSTSTSTTSPAPSYNGHTLIPDDLTSQTVPRAEADKILVFNFVASGVDASAERSGMPNIVETEYVITVNDSAYTVFDVAPDNDAEPAVPAATYNVVLTGTAGTYEVTIATADAGFVFNLGGAQVEEGDTVTVTVAAGP